MTKKISTVTKITAVQKSLNAAARLLNRSIHSPLVKADSKARNDALFAMNETVFLVTVHQPWCIDEDRPLGASTTDERLASSIATSHHNQTGHLIDVIHSDR